jgi:hypothetical protein
MKKALVVGINNYLQAPLTACINDAKEVANLLRFDGTGMGNFDDVRIVEDVATKGALVEQIYNLFKREDDVALFYYSGHGGVDNVDSYLVAPDARKYDLGVSVNTILKIANESKCQNRIIILDCCHSGALGTTNLIGGTTSLINNGVTILAASRADEVALEVNGHGVFTNLFLEALKGGAADISGNITPGSIYAYIDKALGAFDQRPVFKTNVNKFVSLRRVSPMVSPEMLQKITEFFAKPEDEFPLTPSYEDTNDPKIEHKVIEPYATVEDVKKFKILQKYQSVGLVTPVGAPFMYFAAMESKSCKLTPLGQHYWRLAKEYRIR